MRFDKAFQLTDEQNAIVRHETGPALVFAVAGAGKTTSMVHRIQRLVQKGTPPGSILATSFGRATVDDIRRALEDLGVRGVECSTIHALGRRIVAYASRRSLWPNMLNEQDTNPTSFPSILADRALKRLAREQGVERIALGIETDELVAVISAWKQNLVYADLNAAQLPKSALKHAKQASHRNPDFITLYHYYETERKQNGWLTFDDMLVLGWEALERFSEVRAHFQSLYNQVMVDEFQDVNKAQYLILYTLAERHRNYMVIGDDDQCIYEWRGARPSYILNFKDDYSTTALPVAEYFISENFRSRASHVALANAVICHNVRRRSKELNLTQGFEGDLHLVPCRDALEEARYIVAQLQTHFENGGSGADAAILVRAYAQTPFIETALIEARIPYTVVGNVPFYKRKEVATLLHYLEWASLEGSLRSNGTHGGHLQQANYVRKFNDIIWQPNRYVSRAVIERVTTQATRNDESVIPHLIAAMGDVHQRTARQLENFIGTVDGLLARLNDPADETVKWLIDSIEYEEYLRRTSAIEEIGEGKIRTAQALAHFAAGHPNVAFLLDRIRRLAFDHNFDRDPDPTWLKILTIHRAKGLQWPIVFVPDCNEGIVPMLSGDPDKVSPTDLLENEVTDADLEGERRLFYVAITRPQNELHLLYNRTKDISRFLTQANASGIDMMCRNIRRILTLSPDDISDDDLVTLCSGVEQLYGLKRFFASRWQPQDAIGLLNRLDRLDAKIGEAEVAVTVYRKAVEEHKFILAAQSVDVVESEAKRLAAANGTRIEVPKPVHVSLPRRQRVTFSKQGEEVMATAGGQTIGPVRLRDNPNLSRDWPWDLLSGYTDGTSRSNKTLFVTLNVPVTVLQTLRSNGEAMMAEPPAPPSDFIQILASETFLDGYQFIRSTLVEITKYS